MTTVIVYEGMEMDACVWMRLDTGQVSLHLSDRHVLLLFWESKVLEAIEKFYPFILIFEKYRYKNTTEHTLN